MDFEEFMWAMGNEVMYPYIRKCFEINKPMGDFHREAMRYFRQYLIVDGMPQAVMEYVNSRDFTKQKLMALRMFDFPDALGPKSPIVFNTFVPF